MTSSYLDGWHTSVTDPTANLYNLKTLQSDEQFNSCYIILTSQLWKFPFEVQGQFKKVVQEFKLYTDFINWRDLQKKIFNELFAGHGSGILILNDWDYESPRIDFLPCRINNRTYVKPMQSMRRQEIIYFELTDGLGKVLRTLTPDQVHYIALNDWQLYGESIIKKVAPYIILKQTIYKALQKKAKAGFKEITSITPDYSVVSALGNQANQIMSDWKISWDTYKHQLQAAIENGDTAFVSPVPLQSKILSTSLTQNMVDKLLDICDKKIYTGCTIAGSLTNDEANNRAKSEQDRDNLSEITIKYWHNLLAEAGTWCINRLTQNRFSDLNYKLVYPTDPTAELILIREQNLNLITNVLPALKAQGIQVSIDSIKKILASLDLEMEGEPDPNVSTQSTTTEPSVRAVKKNIPQTSYKNIANHKKLVALKNKFKKALFKQYDSFLDSIIQNRIQIGTYNYPELDTILSAEKLYKDLDTISQITLEDYQNQYKKTVAEVKNKTDIITDKVKLTLKGEDDYKGTTATTATQINKELSKLISEDQDSTDIFDYFKSRKDYFIDNGFKRLEEGLFVSLYYDLSSSIALGEGDDYVGALDVNDSNVRPAHRTNDGRMWKNGQTAPGGSSSPWSEFGCRCSYTWGTKQDLLEAGFIL
jgi:hypothetical protein